jgi:NAD(P)-dependent dehydrogenase (short-subunit alcohol dehydrogenase family)
MTPGPERRASSQTAKPVWKNPRTILITGATGGIGAALARNYASVGRTLILHGRDQERLAALSEICQARGARVLQMTFDLRDADTAVGELRSISQRESIDLAIVNAGVTKMIGDGEQIVGGLNDSSNAVFGVGSAELYDPVANTWSTAGSMVTQRQHFILAGLGDGRVLLDGGTPNASGLPEFYH